ncbi:MAG TPA: hypothetical protein VJ768_02875 [Anaerolineales bacterium]|nr:hypothetical protein [Anaerolineales bacterium]
MLKKTLLMIVLVMSFLAACSSPSTGDVSPGADIEPTAQAGTTQGETLTNRLKDDFSGALSIQGQLAAGTILLDEGDLAVDETLASQLLPLWQAVQSLTTSDTAAAEEITAVLNQIQDTMAPEQVSAIAGMALTEDALTQMLEDGSLGFGPRGSGDSEGEVGENTPGTFPGGGFPGGGPGGGAGGFPGGGPGGAAGGFPGGGPGGAGGEFQGLEPEALATRMAEIEAEGGISFQERALLGSVIRLLGTKTGEFSDTGSGPIFDTVFTLISEETGLTVEEIQSAVADGTTLADLLQAHDGDVETVRQALIEAFSELPNADELDLDQMAAQWLGTEE